MGSIGGLSGVLGSRASAFATTANQAGLPGGGLPGEGAVSVPTRLYICGSYAYDPHM